ncbi:hypothetical protein JG688_00017722 [Phytophthora aleatoria]|uniref:Uncharacterized protein n=1 Tax=Phytophthora aleatoria TaxID=2496075 RepID=A0A8J5MBZ5_9STRA|nr:hypothetical protein JG688_00017722 [Phytophthora aleatoria]
MIEKVPCTVELTRPTRGCCRQIDEAMGQAHARESKRVAPATVTSAIRSGAERCRSSGRRRHDNLKFSLRTG